MIDRTAVKRLTLVSAVLFVVAAALALSIWRSPALAGGMALGFVLGLAPFLSWTWVAATRRRALALFLLVVKLALYSGALYLCVTRELVSPAGVAVGLTIVVFTFVGGALMIPPAKPNGAHP